MKIVKEYINEIKRNREGSGLGAIGIGKEHIIARKNSELYKAMKKIGYNFWNQVSVSNNNKIHNNAANKLSCHTEDLVTIDFFTDKSMLLSELRVLFDKESTTYNYDDRFLVYDFYIWEEPEFILYFEYSNTFSNDKRKITEIKIYIDNTKLKFFNPSIL